MPVPWKGLGDIGTPFLSYESKILEEYHTNIEDMTYGERIIIMFHLAVSLR